MTLGLEGAAVFKLVVMGSMSSFFGYNSLGFALQRLESDNVMMICLKTAAHQPAPTRVQLHLSERLPPHIISDCILDCEYLVQRCRDYYLLKLDVSGILTIQCQRCLGEFTHPYDNQTELAICRDEVTAENLMEQYECIASSQDEVDLASIVTDELHLYAPEKHAELIECTSKMPEGK